MAVNITARHLADAQFAQAVVDKLDGAGIPHRNLQIELTERTLIEASNSALSSLRALRNADLQVGLDDFGTGYSSLGICGSSLSISSRSTDTSFRIWITIPTRGRLWLPSLVSATRFS